MPKEKKEENYYALCDFCHKAKPAKELEKIVVTYRKCKDCLPEQFEVSSKRVMNPQSQFIPSTVNPKRVNIPPPFLQEAFNPPSEIQPAITTSPPMAGNIKAEVKSDDQSKEESKPTTS